MIQGEESLDQLINSGLGMPIMEAKEAKARGMKYYWSGKPCLKGHNSKRLTSYRACAACTYLINLKRAPEAKAYHAQIKNEALKQRTKHLISERSRQIILEEYALSGDLEKAAKKVDLTVPELNVQLAKSATFASQMNTLEKRLRVAKENDENVYRPVQKQWTKDDYRDFIRAYIDTGNIATARDAVGASASNYFEELEKSAEFAEMVKVAEPKAAQALEEKAIQLALAGNYQLLNTTLKAKLPEYKDKIQIDQNVNHLVKLSDDTLTARILDLVNRYKVLDGEFTELIEHEPQGQGNPAGLLGRVGETANAKQV